MAAKKKTKLFKIAAEINIGREEIVKFLQSKGFDIQNKPTVSLDEDMVNAVYDKFKKELRAVEVQRKKIEKHKTTKKQSSQAKAEPKDEEEVKSGEKEEIPSFDLSSVQKEDKTEPDQSEPKEEMSKPEEKQEEEEKLPKPSKEEKEAESEITQKEEADQEEDDHEEKPEKEKKEEDEKPAEAEETPKTEEEELGSAPQLRGLRVLGKINMKKKKAEEEEKKRKEKEKAKQKKKAEEEAKAKEKTKKKEKEKKSEEEAEEEQVQVRNKFKHRSKKKKPRIKKGQPEEEAPKSSQGKKTKKDDKKRKRRKSIREQISEEEVEKAIKQTLSGMSESSSGVSRAKIKQKKKQEREEKELKQLEEQEKEAQTLRLTEFVTTSDLANIMGKDSNEIILKCMELGLMVTINQRLDKETIALIAADYDYEVEFVDEKQVQFIEDEDDPEETKQPRSPIVTIMGHVDHGKTSLLDKIRNTNVVQGEAGGITQHIGAYRVKMPDDKSITFLDTPGHEAFTAMRARGAQVTDLVVLVVAADDSVMPQTIEAISHAKAAEVPIVVAINKVDKPDSNPDRIKQQLTDHDVLVEEWGGKHQSVEISAKFNKNLDQLLEKILLESELLELKANPDRSARGIVVESNMLKGLGAVATVIVQKGTLQVGDTFVSGTHHGKVRALQDESGANVKKAGPSDPVLVIGYNGLPEAGDSYITTKNEQEARRIANERSQLKREQEMRQVRHVTLDEISQQIQLGGVKELFLIIKGDVAGSVEALSDALLKLSTEEVRVAILHKGVGPITDSDVMLAAASGAVVIGFNVSPRGSARKVAERENVEIRNYNIIYDCINDVQLALEGLLTPEYKEEVKATVEVRKTFKISKVGTVAGCYVQSGKIHRNDKVRVLHDGFKVYEGSIGTLKRGKDDVKEVDQQFECGIQFDGFNDIHEGDIIEAYKIVEIKRKLK